MELPQPRPLGTQGGFLKTRDFLQPLERGGKCSAKEDKKVEMMAIENNSTQVLPASVEHLLPGGIGISYFNQRIPKTEGSMLTVAQSYSDERNDEYSNCSSYPASDFTLWEESAIKGKTGKENVAGVVSVVREAGMKIGERQWPVSSERPSQLFSNHNHPSNTFSSLSSSQPSSVHKNQSFMHMIKSAKSVQHDEEDDDEFVVKKEPSPQHKSNLTVKVDGRSTDQKANTPRSKHSATEQRRRSKINDRFQMLRGLIPTSDQKRDKASFLLEVIEYIQYLQERVQNYEGLCHGWNPEAPKLKPWKNGLRPADGFVDQSRGMSSGSGPVLMFPAKFDENITDSPTIPQSGQNAVESDMSAAPVFKGVNHYSGLANKDAPFSVLRQPNIFPPGGSSSAQLLHRLASETENTVSQPSSQLWQTKSCTTECAFAADKMEEQELTIESGTISISTVYSQGLLNTLTQALQSSGVDLSQASISVQIDLGKKANGLNSSASTVKDDDAPSSNQAMAHSRVASTREESDQALKKLKTGRS